MFLTIAKIGHLIKIWNLYFSITKILFILTFERDELLPTKKKVMALKKGGKKKITLIKPRKGEEWKLMRFKLKTVKKRYYVSNLGRVKSVDKITKDEYLRKGTIDNRGCYVIGIQFEDGKVRPISVHKEVAKKFVNRKSKKQIFVVHKNFNKLDNKAKNLEWATPDEHWEYVKKRRKKLGIEIPHHGLITNSKLTESKVAMIKKYLLKGKTKVWLSNKYGVSSTQLKRIERGENWANVAPKK